MNRVRTITRTIVEEVQIIDLESDLTIDLDLLFALCDADLGFDFVNITDPALRARLEAAQYIYTNAKGSSYASDKLKTIAREENLNI
jgi:hypothetical protein